jgi:hypothetical protein
MVADAATPPLRRRALEAAEPGSPDHETSPGREPDLTAKPLVPTRLAEPRKPR